MEDYEHSQNSERDTIVFELNENEFIKLKGNGDIFIKGELIENDADLVQGLREWLTQSGMKASLETKTKEIAEEFAIEYNLRQSVKTVIASTLYKMVTELNITLPQARDAISELVKQIGYER